MINKLLTVCIPTFNRNKELNDLLNVLIKQNNNSVEFLIIDNFSELPVADSIISDNILLPSNFKIIRNLVNIGGGANILRCFEICSTEWIWIIGDDDIVEQNSLCIVMEKIKKNRNSIMLSFSSIQHIHKENKSFSNLKDFINSITYWGHINFTSTSVFNNFKLKDYLKTGHIYVYTWSAHIAMVIAHLNEKGGTVNYLKDKIICKISTSSVNNRWEPLRPAISKFFLSELVSDYNLKKELVKNISKSPSDEFVFLVLLIRIKKGESFKLIRNVYKTYMKRKYFYNKNILFYLKYYTCMISLYFNQTSFFLISKILKNKLSSLAFKSDNSRI